MPKIIFLSGARMNGTIIARYFGQYSGAALYNENATYSNEHKMWYFSDEKHTRQIDEMIEKAADFSVFHEMAGDLSLDELKRLKNASFIIVLVLRNPRKQFLSLKKLSLDAEFRKNHTSVCWQNIEKFRDEQLIDYAINSEEFMISTEYRRQICTKLCLDYHAEFADNLVKYRGEDFHKICAITKDWPNPTANAWNGPAATSLKLLPDVSAEITDSECADWERQLLPFCIDIYNKIINNNCIDILL